jgi:hypothetical protein
MMREEQEIKKLAKIFSILGVDDPEGWARSEIQENIPQLVGFLILRAAWENIISEDKTDWMDKDIEYGSNYPDRPCAGAGLAMKRMIDKGVDRKDIVELIRVKQYEAVFGMLFSLDDPGDLEPEVGEMGWVLNEVGMDGKYTGRIIQGLYESLMSLDPTGRELCPME